MMAIFSFSFSTFNDNHCSHQHSGLFPGHAFWQMIHRHVEKAVGSLKKLLKAAGEENAHAPSVCNTSKMQRCLNDGLAGMIKNSMLKMQTLTVMAE